jgi:hypothetical protein
MMGFLYQKNYSWALGVALILGSLSVAHAKPETALEIRWNPDWLREQNISVTPINANHHSLFFLSTSPAFSPFDWKLNGRSLVALRAGHLSLIPALSLKIPTRRKPITLNQLRVDPNKTNRLLLQDEHNHTWLEIDRLMLSAQLDPGYAVIRTSDVQISSMLAQALKQPRLSAYTVAELRLRDTLAQQENILGPKACGAPNWPGLTASGIAQTYQADVFMQELSLQYTRCRNCDGPDGIDGEVVLTPNVSLINNVNQGSVRATIPDDPLGTSAALWAADVPWYTKFSANSAPHNNDQHPFLVWNMYRLDPNGAITQIGRSGLKHAFATTNSGAECDSCNGNNVLGRACQDTYGVSSNDSAYDLGPRNELLPASGIWGRCGSIYDSNCDGNYDSPSLGYYDFRMITRESQIAPSLHSGAQWFIEAWYVIRDDINIFNSMATRSLNMQWTAPPSPIWAVSHTGSSFRLGPAIDRWLESTPSNLHAQRSERITTPYGQIQIATRVTTVPEGYRYDYVVMNFDYRYGVVSGEEPNRQINSTRGIAQIQIPKLGSALVSSAEFADGDLETTNNWQLVSGDAKLSWQAPSIPTELSWGTLHRFSFVSAQAPELHRVALLAYTGATLSNYQATLYTPGDEITFSDGFENR